MKKIIPLIAIFATLISIAQENLNLEECYTLVNKNYPLAKQFELLNNQNKLDLQTISSQKLPQFDLSAQASYQSEVTEIPIPNSNIESLNKDQYKALFTINQLIYNGGLIDASSNLKSAQFKTQEKQVKVNLYQLKKQVNQLFFSILLSQEKHELLVTKQTQLQAKLKEVKSGIANGVVIPTSDKVLEAELLKINQQFTEIDKNKIALIKTLSLLVGKSIDTSFVFEKPIIEARINSELNRPELELFQLKKEEIESTKDLISKKNYPKLLGFANGGYGNPGLNFLDNSFQTFYTLGVKLNWNVFDWNTNKKQRQALLINKDIVDNEAEIFKLNTNIELNQQEIEINKISEFIETGAKIIKLRKEALKTADSQLRNGVITTSAYITELTNLYEDENIMVTHTIQLQLAKANYNITKGQ